MQNHKCHTQLHCQFILQVLTGIRVSNLYDLQKNSKLDKRKCLTCNSWPCQITTFKCLDNITFLKTKTTTITVPIIFYGLGCYQFLRQLNKTNSTSEYNKYSQFLKSYFNIQTHDCLKFIPNFHYGCKQRCNSGRWINPNSNKNIDQYYLHQDSKFLELYKALFDHW